MLYAQWVQRVLQAMAESENDRTRLVGVPAAALREPLGLALDDVDAIEDAIYDLEVLGLARRRPAGTFNLTISGTQAAAHSIQQVCGSTISEADAGLTDDQRNVLKKLVELSQADFGNFVRLRYVDVEVVSDKIGVRGTHEQQESFLLPLVVSACIDYREFKSDRDIRPLLAGVVCAGTPRVEDSFPWEAARSGR